jgi:hypothetical protein
MLLPDEEVQEHAAGFGALAGDMRAVRSWWLGSGAEPAAVGDGDWALGARRVGLFSGAATQDCRKDAQRSS